MATQCRLFFFLFALVLPGRLLSYAPIHIQEAVDIGGLKQWISIKGIHVADPVLLFLHGGPGNSSMRYGDKFTNELQKHFVVVQWDQRESGKTAQLNSSDKPLTVALMESDAVEMVRYLCSRFSKPGIYLMGHSWGGFLGLRVAASHPELIKAYFAVSPMVYQLESERLSLGWMQDSARNARNQNELDELAKIRLPFQNGEQLFFHRKWLARGMGTPSPSKAFVETWAKKWLFLFNEASEVNLFVTAAEIKCPVYFFVGARDYQTHFKLTEAYFHAVKAEKKDLFWFSNSAHNLNLTEPGKLQQIVISILTSKN